jgi:hypothetical protein
MTTQTDDLLWAEQVAEMFDPPVTARTVIFYASQARRLQRDRDPLPADFPLPADHQPRSVPVHTDHPAHGGPTRVVNSPRWSRAAVQACLDARRTWQRPRGERGRYLGKDAG